MTVTTTLVVTLFGNGGALVLSDPQTVVHDGSLNAAGV